MSSNNQTPPAPDSPATAEMRAVVDHLGSAALTLVEAAKDALRTERSVFDGWGKSYVGWWFKDFDAAKQAMLDFAVTHARELEDAAKLLADNRADLVDLNPIREFRDLHAKADTLRRDAPTRHRPPQVHTLLPLLKLPADAEAAVSALIGPALSHNGLLERALSDWRFDLAALPQAAFVQVGSGARGIIFDHPVLATRLAAETGAEAVAAST